MKPMAVIAWMIVFLAFLALEIAQKSLTTLWFAGGALAAAVAAYLYAGTGTQLVWFASVSLLLLVIVRPAAFLAVWLAGGKRSQKGRVHGTAAGLE